MSDLGPVGEHGALATPEQLAELRSRQRPPHVYSFADLGELFPEDIRSAAALYGRLGLHPLVVHGVHKGACTCRLGTECSSTGKHPRFRNWETAPLDSDGLDRDLAKHWQSNLGLRTGTQPDGAELVVIDIDGPLDLIAGVEEQLGKLPPTLTATTGRGFHLFYKSPVAVPNSAGKLAPGVDIRGTGGQVLVAPSIHASGRRYRWTNAIQPAVLP